MTTFLLATAFAGAPAILDRDDALYLADSRRGELAAAWFLERLDQHLVDYVKALGQLPEQRTPALVAQVEQWQEAHPDDDRAPIALAMAHSYAGLTEWTWTTPFGKLGAWCGPAQEALQMLPADPHDRYAVLRARRQVARACGTDDAEDEAAQKALALSGDAGPYLQAWFGLREGIDDEVLAAVEGAIEARPARVGRLRHAFDEDAEGPALEAVRARLLTQARSMATSDRPAHVAAAVALLTAASLDDEVHPVREHLARLDPDNPSNAWALEDHPPKDPDAPADPATLLDPVRRLAALQAQRPSGSRWERRTYWAATADAAEAAGDDGVALEALERLMKVSPGSSSHLRYARAAARMDTDLGKAAKAVDQVIAWKRDPDRYGLPRAGEEATWRTSLADALDVRAQVSKARGQKARAADDLEEAMLLTGPTPDRLMRLGELYDDDRAAPLLARALAQLPADDPRVPPAQERLTEWLAKRPGWAPDLTAYVRAFQPPKNEVAAPEPALDGGRFQDLLVQIDGEEVRLFDIEGPIVLDVWATWCGPCMQSLPHLDALARRHEGDVTFIAVSVDEELATAERYLARRGEAAFTAAFLGSDGMSQLGVTGIPAMFVFDGEHQLTAQLSGWGPGNRQLDDAVDAMLGGG